MTKHGGMRGCGVYSEEAELILDANNQKRAEKTLDAEEREETGMRRSDFNGSLL
jgi:hypothetical protein